MKVTDLQWDDQNVEHIARHNVNPDEVEDVCFGVHIAAREEGGRYILSGQSTGGRYLTVVVEHVARRLFRPITAFEMSEGYKRGYRKRLKRR